MKRHSEPSPLQLALNRADRSPAAESELRSMLIYAVEVAEIPELISMGRQFDEILDRAATGQTVPPPPNPLPTTEPETKRRRRRERRKK